MKCLLSISIMIPMFLSQLSGFSDAATSAPGGLNAARSSIAAPSEKVYSREELSKMSKAQLIDIFWREQQRLLLSTAGQPPALPIANAVQPDHHSVNRAWTTGLTLGSLLVAAMLIRRHSVGGAEQLNSFQFRTASFRTPMDSAVAAPPPTDYNIDRCKFNTVFNAAMDIGEKLAQAQEGTDTNSTAFKVYNVVNKTIPWVKLFGDVVYYKCAGL